MTKKDLLKYYTIVIAPIAEEWGGGFAAYYSELRSSYKGYGATPQDALSELTEMVNDDIVNDPHFGKLPEPDYAIYSFYNIFEHKELVDAFEMDCEKLECSDN